MYHSSLVWITVHGTTIQLLLHRLQMVSPAQDGSACISALFFPPRHISHFYLTFGDKQPHTHSHRKDFALNQTWATVLSTELRCCSAVFNNMKQILTMNVPVLLEHPNRRTGWVMVWFTRLSEVWYSVFPPNVAQKSAATKGVITFENLTALRFCFRRHQF